MRWALLIITLILGIGCATSRSGDCRERAKTAYDECNSPIWAPHSDREKLTTSDQQMACREQYQQALDQCPGSTKTSTISGPFNFD
jgi:hypothetical protein